MALEDPQLLRHKNRKRLRNMLMSTFVLGVNVTAPSSSKKMLRIITIILIISSWVDMYGHVCYILQYRNSIAIIAESICTMVQVMISNFKLSYCLFVDFRFYDILRLVESHELIDKIQFLFEETPYNCKLRKEARKILDDCWRIANAQFNFYMISCIAIASYYILNSQIVNTVNWFIGNTNHTNILPFPVLFPMWENKMNDLPYYVILTFIDGSACFIAGVGAISFDGIFIIIALHGVALYRILRHMIAFTSSVPKRLRLDYLRQCIDHQERSFQYCRAVNNLYLHMSLVQFLVSLVIIGVVMFQASVGLENNVMTVIRMVIYMVAAVFQVVIYCLNGQLITNESEELTFAWYACNWYDESTEFKQLIRMMMLRNNSVFYMRASWFSTMSLPTLMELLKTSGSYFLLLRSFVTK